MHGLCPRVPKDAPAPQEWLLIWLDDTPQRCQKPRDTGWPQIKVCADYSSQTNGQGLGNADISQAS